MAEHGTLTMGKRRGCDCPPCVDVLTQWYANRSRQIAYGTWQPYVDAEPARLHVRDLMAYGIGWQQVAKLAGVSTATVGKLLFGASWKGLPPSKKIRPETERKLLAVAKTPANIAKWMDTAGTRRRLQALVAVGWPLKWLTERASFDQHTFGAIASGRRSHVTPGTYRAVVGLYDALWNQPPPATTVQQRRSTGAARSLARRRGWLPPLAWDDDLIDLTDEEFAQALRAQAEQMTDAEVTCARRYRNEHDDRTPLTQEAAREHARRRRRRVKARAAS